MPDNEADMLSFETGEPNNTPKLAPGPWNTRQSSIYGARSSLFYCTRNQNSSSDGEAEMRANARLILAAAPDLYDALQQALEFLEELLEQFPIAAQNTMLRTWRAALAKANPSGFIPDAAKPPEATTE